jgi:ABC-type lipoprotein release transport system permease subunit
MMKYIFGAIGLLVGYIISYRVCYALEGIENATSGVIYSDYGIAILIGTLALGLISMGIGQKLSNNKK